MPSMSSRQIDVSIEHKHADPERRDGAGHPNTCPSCGSHYRDDELAEHLRVCPQCGYHFPVRAPDRIGQLADAGTFDEEDGDLRSADPLDFFDLKPYKERLAEAEVGTGLGDAILTGRVAIDGHPCRIAAMDFSFMGGSMGSVVGERFARACERAAEDHGVVVSVSASGGARMQEGVNSLFQMAKTTAVLQELSRGKLPFVSVLTDPTMGGVSASFAFVADLVVAEPGALIGFAGPRVIEQTVREKLPEGFQRAEFLLEKGALDMIVDRRQLRDELARLLAMLTRQPAISA